MVRPFANHRLEADRIEVLIGVRLHVQDDVGAGGLARRRRDAELTGAVRGPGERLLGARLSRCHLDAVRDHERGIEADAELTDQAGPLLRFRRRERRAECAGAGAGDGAQVVDQLLPAHADAVIGDQQRAGVLVGHDADLRLGRWRERRVRQRLEAAPVHRIGGVRHQLAQEYFPLGIERVHHQIEQPSDLRAEIVLFRNRIVHRQPSLRAAICDGWPLVSMWG